jgi:predicted transposase YbfD/YdcC
MNFTINGATKGINWESGEEVKSLYEQLKQLKDKRKRRGIRYPLAVALVMIVVAKLSGQDEVRGIAEWVSLRARLFVETLGSKHKTTPYHTTLSRILNEAVDIMELEASVSAYWQSRSDPGEKIAIDGKTLRGTIDEGGQRGQHLLSAYGTDSGLVMGQLAVGKKDNEISAAPQLLAGLEWQGRVVSGDAMFAQHQLSAQIVAAGGAYLWVVKDNQPTLRSAIERLFGPETCLKAHSKLQTDFQTASSLDKAHGRLERRTLTASCLLNDFAAWEGIGQVFKIERQVKRLKTGKSSHPIDYGITSLSPIQAPPDRLLTLVRTHWRIENTLHYPRDVSLHEDACRVRYPQVQHALATLNNLVLGLIHLCHFDYVPTARRFFDANVSLALQLVT